MISTATSNLVLPVDTTPVRAAALLYARAGFAPVPVHGISGDRCRCGDLSCSAAGKHPVGIKWQARASADIDTARELFAEHEHGNIGIVLGASYLVLYVEAGSALPIALPPTLTSRSGSGHGEHRIFVFAPGQDPSEIAARKLAPGIEIKRGTNQIVVAPSMHRSGNRYRWLDTVSPSPVPDALYELIRKRRVVSIRHDTPTQQPVEDDWRQRLVFQRSKSGPDKIARHHENAVVTLRYCPAWRLPSGKPRIALDTHAQRVLVTAPPWHESDAPHAMSPDPIEWTDSDSARLSSWIRREVLALDLGVNDCDRAVAIVAESNTCHPFREYLDGLAWDGIERLGDWLTDYLGCAPGPYTSSIGRWWLVSAAARTYRPGCKADHVLILEGPQGARKSTALRVIAGDRWFSDTPIEIGSKDAYLALQGRVIVELAELDSLKRADHDRAKTFFSSPVDHYRPPYARRTIAVPRGCVFAGTLNPHLAYFSDPTGGRRYWPTMCGAIDLDALARARDQLWAEAAARFKRGERWWPDGPEETEMCTDEIAPRTESEAWEDAIRKWCDGQSEVSTAKVLEGACRMQVKDFTRAAQMRVAQVLGELGFTRKRKREAGELTWVYRR